MRSLKIKLIKTTYKICINVYKKQKTKQNKKIILQYFLCQF